jgi:hypothetical protein
MKKLLILIMLAASPCFALDKVAVIADADTGDILTPSALEDRIVGSVSVDESARADAAAAQATADQALSDAADAMEAAEAAVVVDEETTGAIQIGVDEVGTAPAAGSSAFPIYFKSFYGGDGYHNGMMRVFYGSAIWGDGYGHNFMFGDESDGILPQGNLYGKSFRAINGGFYAFNSEEEGVAWLDHEGIHTGTAGGFEVNDAGEMKSTVIKKKVGASEKDVAVSVTVNSTTYEADANGDIDIGTIEGGGGGEGTVTGVTVNDVEGTIDGEGMVTITIPAGGIQTITFNGISFDIDEDGNATITYDLTPSPFSGMPSRVIDDTDSPYSVIAADYAIAADTSADDVSIVLPDLSTEFVSVFIQKRGNSNVVSVERGASTVWMLYNDGSVVTFDWWPDLGEWHWRE